ncbi:MAG: DUF2948 family protein [Planktomarina sp.]|uniref:DUF2948 family protein n=1 Tax=Planktomarina sp. TaxID=2024851 RepID=UPI00326180C0|nr:DUF2948 family protein [Planktomarina sp.]
MSDARFEDGMDKPLRLIAFDAEDLQVVSAMTQDAVWPAAQMAWHSKERRFAVLLNRFRWEAHSASQAERVQSVLSFEDVKAVQTQGFDQRDSNLILSLLSITFIPATDGTGTCLLTLAGDGAIRLEVEALEAGLRDVTRPYVSPAKRAPSHD